MTASRPDPEAVFDPSGGEWREVDGVWFRRAARVIAVDEAGRVLLLHGVDPVEPTETWWFTPGGGLTRGEDERAGAVRELFEECGLQVSAAELVGPVAFRSERFRYLGREVRQDEVLFFTRIARGAELNRDGWTAIEQASVTDMRWWSVDGLSDIAEPIYPPAIGRIVTNLLTYGWDGTTRTVD